MSIPEPKNGFERAWYQFSLRKKTLNKKMCIISKAYYFILFNLLLVYLCLKRRYLKYEKYKLIYIKISNNQGVLSDNIIQNRAYKEIDFDEGFLLDKDVFKFINKCIHSTKLDFEFLFRILFNLSKYEYVIKKYSPDEIITTYESSYTSSILTEFCRSKGITHTNFMHGEKLLGPYNTFFMFDRFYVWDVHYIELFNKSRALVDEYLIYNPWENINVIGNIPITKDYTFYLSIPNQIEIEKLKVIVSFLKSQNLIVKIRLHPSVLNLKDININSDILENSNDIDIVKSIKSSKFIVSLSSTVLFQAYCMGKDVIIDDITNAEEFDRLLNLDYIMLSKKHELLSQIINDLKKGTI